jgi:release factor glutamine methyltransferase
MNEAELLFTEILNCNRLSLYLNKEEILNPDKSVLVSSVLKRRIKGEPIQYILGRTEFMGLEFKVSPDVFIPRPETEILVEAAIKLVTSQNILDLGTGSGCIAISLAKFLQNAVITATDISKEALIIAEKNAKLNNVNINFVQSDLFTQYAIRNTQYDLVISNPPYIPAAEIDKLQPEIKYEPRAALDGGSDGLCFYRKIISRAADFLKAGGFLMLEVGFNQREPIEDIFQKSEKFEVIEVIKDYNCIDRVVIARKRN